jgi:tetratricopeptide (TPR) repeat protein
MRPSGFVFVAVLSAASGAFAQVQPPEPPTPPSVIAPVIAPATVPAPADTPAAPAPGSTRARALEHYERGRASYAVGRYRAAALELERAYELDPSGTNLLFNLGAVLERLGQIDRAIDAYERYRRRVRDPEERRRTARIVTRLRGARVELADISRRHGNADGVFWGVAGAALASTSVGTLWFATAREGASRAIPITFTVAGASLFVLAGVLYFAREAPPRRTLYVSAPFDGAGIAAGLVGTF